MNPAYTHSNASEFVQMHQVRLKINNVARNTLYILEDLKDDHQIPDEKFKRIRKRILDLSNDALRELDSAIKYS